MPRDDALNEVIFHPVPVVCGRKQVTVISAVPAIIIVIATILRHFAAKAVINEYVDVRIMLHILYLPVETPVTELHKLGRDYIEVCIRNNMKQQIYGAVTLICRS